MFYAFVIVCVLNGPCPLRVDDTLGPYKTKAACFLRGAELVAKTSIKFPVLSAQTGCSIEPICKLFDDCKEDGKKDGDGVDKPILAPDCRSDRSNCRSS